MKRITLLNRAITALLLVLFFGCSKVDDRIPAPNFNPDLLSQKFFHSHRSSDVTESKLVSYFEGLDDSLKFIGKTSQKIGFPRWDKILSFSANKNKLHRSQDDENSQVHYIPFVRDSQNYVNAAMVVLTNASDTSFYYLCDWQYSSKQNSLDAIEDEAERFAMFFMQLDHEVFGHKRFKITNDRLFQKNNQITAFISLNDSASYPNVAARMEYVEYCQNVTIYFVDCPFQGMPHITECYNGCDRCSLCLGSLSYQYCWGEWVDYGGGGGGGGTGGGDGGGGGSGGGAGTPPDDPCNNDPSEGGVNRAMPCGGGGWEPEIPIVDEPEEDPCNSQDRLSGATATLQYPIIAGQVANFAPFNPNVNNQPEQYFVVNNLNGAYVPEPVQTTTTTGGAMQGVTSNTVMVAHTHPYGGFPSPSPGDFYGLGTFNSNFLMNYTIAYNGSKYALYVNSHSQLQAFLTNNPNAVNSSGQFNPATTIGQQWYVIVATLGDQGYTELEAYERATAFVMKQAGVTMVKASPNSNTFKKVGLKIKMQNGTPVLNSYGDPLFENADCP